MAVRRTFESSPGKMSLTAVWISRDEIVDFLLYDASCKKRGVWNRGSQVSSAPR